MTKNNNQNLEARERRIAEARSLNLFVKSVRTQYRISRMVSHDAILDVYAEDTDGKLYNTEVQRTDTVNHARRTRFYTSMIDSECLQKGKNYDEMPEVYILYISRTDLWNAAVNDHSAAAQLMKFFKTADPNDMSQGDLSRRVHFLKSEEGGYQVMCEISEKWYREGEESQARRTALKL